LTRKGFSRDQDRHLDLEVNIYVERKRPTASNQGASLESEGAKGGENKIEDQERALRPFAQGQRVSEDRSWVKIGGLWGQSGDKFLKR